MKRIFLLGLGWLFALIAASEPMNVHETKYDWSQVARTIAGDKTSDYDRAYAIYRWLCANIEYDTTYSIHDADTAFENRRGVCQAYCELFYRIGEPLGLKVDIIGGRSKDRDGKLQDGPGHAWIFVYTNGNSGILIDPTWGAGGVDDGKFKRHETEDDSWFHVDPAWMIFTHYPDSDEYQLMADKIDFETFAKLPSYHPSLERFGFKGKELLGKSLAGEELDLPICYDNSKINILRVPHTGTLRVGTEYEFVLQPKANYEFAIINGDEFDTEWRVNNGQHFNRFVPAAGVPLYVSYRHKGSAEKSWDGLIEYKVAKPTPEDVSNLEKLAPEKSPLLTALPGYDAKKYTKRGIEASKLLAVVKGGGVRKLPEIYSVGDYKLNDIPLSTDN